MKLLNSKTALGIRAASILLATIFVYNRDLTIVANEALRSELMSQILVIPFLLTYLVYRKRKMLSAAIPFESSTKKRKMIETHEAIGAGLCLLAFLLYWHGSYTFNPLEHHVVSLPIFTAGLVLAMFNSETLRVLAFPIFFLLFLVPPPLEFVYAAGTALSILSSEAAYTVLEGMGLPVTLTSQYGTPVIMLAKPGSAPLDFAVDIACAGYYSLTGFTIFAVFVAYIARGAPWRKAAIFLAGFPLICALNVIRIVVIVLIGAQSGMEAAMQAFHLLGGWVLVFMGISILLTLTEKVFKIQLFTTKPKLASCNYCGQNPGNKQHFCNACGRILNPMNISLSKRDLSKTAILAVAAILVINLQVPVFALTEGPTEFTIQTVGIEHNTTAILPPRNGYTTRFVERDSYFEEIAKQDAALRYAYDPIDELGRRIDVTIEIAKTRSSLHRPEICLIEFPLEKWGKSRVDPLSQEDVQILQNPPITARYFAFKYIRSDLTQAILYWYENAYFNTGDGLENKHVKISLIVFPEEPEDIPIIRDELLPFAEAIAIYWQPVKEWPPIALVFSQNGITLLAIAIAFLAIILTYEVATAREDKKSNLRIYNRLALGEEKSILEAVHQAAQKGKPTGEEIASCYEKIHGKTIESDMLYEKLNEAEQVGLIERNIVSREDEPTLVWKSNTALQAL